MIKSTISAVVAVTSIYVWFDVALLMFYIGRMSLNSRVTSINSPIAFLVAGIALKFIRCGPLFSTNTLIFFLACGLTFLYYRNRAVNANANLRQIEVPADYLMPFVFYTFGLLEATQPELIAPYSWVKLSVSNLSAGFWISRSCGYLYRYYLSNSDQFLEEEA